MSETSTEKQVHLILRPKGKTAKLLSAKKGQPEWNKTILAQQRLKEKGLYEEPDHESPTGYYQGRPIIGRDTPINGGVYVGGGEREAIVVDDSREGSRLNEIYDELLEMRRKAQEKGDHFKEGILTDVFELVLRRLPYKEDIVHALARKYNIEPDRKVSLNMYLRGGGGVCRHQALLTAYLLERLGREGKVKGKVSIDRNYIEGKGGHAWVRYTNSVGQVIIIDPAREFIKKLEEISPEIRRFYERPKNLLRRLLKG